MNGSFAAFEAEPLRSKAVSVQHKLTSSIRNEMKSHTIQKFLQYAFDVGTNAP